MKEKYENPEMEVIIFKREMLLRRLEKYLIRIMV